MWFCDNKWQDEFRNFRNYSCALVPVSTVEYPNVDYALRIVESKLQIVGVAVHPAY
jgi:hypothetical protein